MTSSLLDSNILLQLQAKSPRSISQYGRNEETMHRTLGPGSGISTKGLSQSTIEYIQLVEAQRKAQLSAFQAESLTKLDIKTSVVATIDDTRPVPSSDDGRELVSSRRGNRGTERREKLAYEQSKRREFEETFCVNLGEFNTVDEGQLTHRAAVNASVGKSQLGPTAVFLQDDSDDGLSDSCAGGTSLQQQQQGVADETADVELSPAAGDDGTAQQKAASPSGHHNHHGTAPTRLTSSFLSPERFHETKSSNPPVGHYRPKHHLSETAVVGGYIAPPAVGSPRHLQSATDGQETAMEKHASTVSQRILSPAASGYSLKSGGRAESPKSPTGEARLSAAAAATAAALSPTYVFRSGSPKIGPLQKTAAPDEWYWPRNDPGSPRSFNVRGRGDFTMLTPRRPLVDPSGVPDAYYNVTKPTGSESAHTVRQFELQYRPSVTETNAASVALEGDATYDASVAVKPTKPTIRNVDFTKSSPRGEFGPATAATISVDFADELPEPNRRHVATFSYDTMLARKDNLRPMLDLQYDASDGAVSPRIVAAVIDARVPGHQPLTSCDMPTEIGEPPRLELARAKITRDLRFEKYSPRKDQPTHLLDKLYECDEPLRKINPRVLGDPMMHDSLSREKRAKVILPVKPTLQVQYDYPVPRLPAAHYSFTKQVSTDATFSGYEPSHQFVRSHPRAPPVGTYGPNEPSILEIRKQQQQASGGNRSSPRQAR